MWNPGQAPVEGYSNLLHVLFGAAALGVDADPLPLLRWLNRLCVLGLVGMTWLWALRTCRNSALAGLAALLVGLNAPLSFWASSGLETALFTLCVTSGLYFALVGPPSQRSWAALTFATASLARPEGPVFVLVVAAVALGESLWRRRRVAPGVREFLSRHGVWLLLFGIPYLGYFAWTWSYFGYPFPNSVYYKSGAKVPGVLDLQFLAWNAPLLLLDLAAPYRRPGGRALVPLLLIVFHLGMLYDVKTSISYLQRFFLPVFPAAIVLGIAGLDRLVGSRSGMRVAAVASLAAGLVGWSLFHPSVGWEAASGKIPRLNHRIVQRVQVADWLSRHLEPDARVLVSDVGVIGYLLPNPIDDAFGLNDLDFTHRFRQHRGNYVSSLGEREPAAIIVLSKYPDRYVKKYVTDNHLRKLVLDRGYRRSAQVLSALEPHHYWLHVDLDSDHLRAEPIASGGVFDESHPAALIESSRRTIMQREGAEPEPER